MKTIVKFILVFLAFTSMAYAEFVPSGNYSCPSASSVNQQLQSVTTPDGTSWKMKNPVIVSGVPFILIGAPTIMNPKATYTLAAQDPVARISLTPWNGGGNSMSCFYNATITPTYSISQPP